MAIGVPQKDKQVHSHSRRNMLLAEKKKPEDTVVEQTVYRGRGDPANVCCFVLF